MIDFNRNIDNKTAINLFICTFLAIGTIVLYSVFIREQNKEIKHIKNTIDTKKSQISELEKSNNDIKNVENSFNLESEINAYDEYIDEFTMQLIEKNFDYGHINHEMMDYEGSIYPYIINSNLEFIDLNKLNDISNELNHNLFRVHLKKLNDKYSLETNNLYVMNQQFGFKDIEIDNTENIASTNENEELKVAVENDESMEEESKEFESTQKAVETYEEKRIDYKFVSMSDESLQFVPYTEGISYYTNYFFVGDEKMLVVNTINNSNELGKLGVFFDKYTRIIWQDNGELRFNVNDLGSLTPKINLILIDSHEDKIEINGNIYDGYISFDLSNNNYPIFILGFSLELEKNKEAHFSIGNGNISFFEEDIKDRKFEKKIYSVPSFNINSYEDFLKNYNDFPMDEFLRLNHLKVDEFKYYPSYLINTKEPYEIFKKQ
ncbi:MAG: hypothetical protein MSH08_05935 [Ezakiella sp.]|nr:hypothetical protein [Ezakiella sp.]MDD7471865.1 hypothetical protein [Bacillota bacterium]MDY3923829.1 hypothetical protein [Ezakiella sp.]